MQIRTLCSWPETHTLWSHIGADSRGWAARKYVPGSFPTAGNMAHNLYYWGLGVLQWTAWECVLMRLWATGKVPYAADAEVLARPGLLAWNVFWVMLVPWVEVI